MLPLHRELALLASVVALAGSRAPAQQFLDNRRSASAFEVGLTSAVFPIDVNGDGAVDLVLGQRPVSKYQQSPASILLNDGAGRFSVSAQASGAEILAVGDLDADGDVDLVESAGVWINDGRGGMTYQRCSFFLAGPAAVGDLDGDNRPDVVSATTWFKNLGGFRFAAGSPIPSSAPARRPTLFDVDGDADLDLLFPDVPQLFLNDGRGTLTDATATALPAGSSAGADCVVIDFDRDGDLDIVLGSARPTLLLNDRGKFTDAGSWFAAVPPGPVRSIAAGDLDGDGDLDVVLGEAEGGRVLENLGAGFRVATGRWPAVGSPVEDVALVDVDGDSDPDIVAGRENVECDVSFNDGAGQFVRAGTSPIPAVVRFGHAAAGDLDGDGVPDVIVTEAQGWFLRGDGHGTMDPPVALGLGVAGQPFVADMDGDGKLDVLVLEPNALHVLYNAGNGTTYGVRTHRLGLGGATEAVWAVPGDFDGDGRRDVYVVTRGANNAATPDQVWLGGANQTLSASTAGSIPASRAMHGVAGDIDGDADLDLVLDSGLVVFNRSAGGTLAFTTSTESFLHFGRAALALGDLDGDGDLDLVVGSACEGAGCAPSGDSPANSVHWNDGRGGFRSSVLLPGTDFTRTWTTDLADVDGDGDLDILFGNRIGNAPFGLYCRNDGGGQFSVQQRLLDWDDTWRSFVVDVDRDGDLDWLVIDTGLPGLPDARSKVFVNTTRQLHAAHLPRLGTTFPITVFGARQGGVLVVAARAAGITIPGWGHLGLDPASAGAWIALGPAARQTVATRIPQVPALDGAAVYLQALVNEGGALRLTNTLREVLVAH